MRDATKGKVPPPWEKMNLILGNLFLDPENKRLAMVRVVSKVYSIAGVDTPFSMTSGSGATGWTKTVAARRSNSARIGS